MRACTERRSRTGNGLTPPPPHLLREAEVVQRAIRASGSEQVPSRHPLELRSCSMQGTQLIGCLTEPEETGAWQTNRSFHSIADSGVNNTEVGMSGSRVFTTSTLPGPATSKPNISAGVLLFGIYWLGCLQASRLDAGGESDHSRLAKNTLV